MGLGKQKKKTFLVLTENFELSEIYCLHKNCP